MKYVLVVAIGLLTVAPGWSQDEAEFQKWMKTAGATTQSLKKNLDASDGAAASVDAKKLAEVFGQVHEFWMKKMTDDTMKFAVGAQEGFASIAEKSAAGKLPEALDTFKATVANCKGCHDVHREKLPDGTSKIK